MLNDTRDEKLGDSDEEVLDDAVILCEGVALVEVLNEAVVDGLEVAEELTVAVGEDVGVDDGLLNLEME